MIALAVPDDPGESGRPSVGATRAWTLGLRATDVRTDPDDLRVLSFIERVLLERSGDTCELDGLFVERTGCAPASGADWSWT